jgi:non-specific serine/threonine protein kinase
MPATAQLNGGPEHTRAIVTALPFGQRKDNLPAEVTRFIGRRRELPAVAGAVERHRLVTLRGTGGVGKTRLAMRAAAGLRDSFADGCWLVQLSPLRAPGLLTRTVSRAFGLPDEAAGDATRVLTDSLADRELLLLLDTCDHLTGACAELAPSLLAAAPGLRILATSRAPLGAPDEHSLLISPLELPADDAAAAAADAVTLFVDRARAVVPGFTLTPHNTRAVAELCRRLDGIPLALELAAVRLRGMPVEEILARLSDRFSVLGSARTATGRHRSLRAAVDWSYELCTPDEQRLWAELSVFPGGFGAAAAEQVCGPGAAGPLGRLAEKSVVQFAAGPVPGEAAGGAGGADRADRADTAGGDGTDEDGRYQLLDTMREFGAEHLDPGAEARVRTRHRDYYLGLAERAAPGLAGVAQPGWLRRLAAETDNLRVALHFAFTAPGQAPSGQRMTRLLLPYWLMTGQFTEGRRWHRLAAAAAAGGSAEGGPVADGQAAEDAAWAAYGGGVLAVQQGDFDAGGPLLGVAATLATQAGDENLAAHVTDARGILAFNRGDLVTAQAQYEAALAVYRRTKFADPAALVTYARLASVCLLTFDLERALRLCEECLRRCDETGEQWARGTALWVRGGARWLSGDNAAAIEDALTCLRIKDELGDLHTTAMCFDLLSVCLVATGEFDRAAVLYGAGDALWTLLHAPVLMGPGYADIRRGAADAARTELGDERFEALASYGEALSLPGAVAVATGDAPARQAGAIADSAAAAGADGDQAAGTSVPEVPGRGAPGGAEDDRAKRLTRREREVAALVAGGLGNREIAEQLFLSKRTVDSHIEHIFGKLGFSSQTQLATWVLAQDRQS